MHPRDIFKNREEMETAILEGLSMYLSEKLTEEEFQKLTTRINATNFEEVILENVSEDELTEFYKNFLSKKISENV